MTRQETARKVRWRIRVWFVHLVTWAKGKPLIRSRAGKVNEWSYGPLVKALAVAFLAAIIVGSVWLIPKYQGDQWHEFLTAQERPLFVNEARRTMLQFWGGAVVLLGLYFGWRRILQTDEANQIEREGNVTDRFTRAVEQLGHAQAAVRTGAIFALERIATNSPRDAWPIAEILNAYIRTCCGLPLQPQGDVQAAITVLGRRPWRERESHNQFIDFSSLFLAGYDFSEGKFRRLRARGTRFDHAIFEFTDLWDADLRGASFAHIRGLGMNVSHANASHSVWSSAFAWSMRGQQTQLKRAMLDGLQAKFADLDGARLNRADLTGAYLERAQLRKATLPRSVLRNTVLTSADLSGADCAAVIAAGTILTGAKLDAADFRKADLRGAVGLVAEQLSRIVSDPGTKLPESGQTDESTQHE